MTRMARWIAAALVFAPSLALAASFNCTTARAPDEIGVCASCDLQQLDVKMDTLYGVLSKLSAMGSRAELRDAQRAWLSRRALCGNDQGCLRQAYATRIGELESYLNTIYARGPF